MTRLYLTELSQILSATRFNINYSKIVPPLENILSRVKLSSRLTQYAYIIPFKYPVLQVHSTTHPQSYNWDAKIFPQHSCVFSKLVKYLQCIPRHVSVISSIIYAYPCSSTVPKSITLCKWHFLGVWNTTIFFLYTCITMISIYKTRPGY